MHRPKQQALAFLLGALLVGGVVGFSADRVFRHDDTSIQAKRIAMYDDLGLQPTQRTAMDSLLDARNCQFESVLKPIQPALDSIRGSTRTQIDRILTSEQRAKLDVRRRENDARHDAERKRIQAGCR
jgi:Spy/CpxP family protein refolding chaperone